VQDYRPVRVQHLVPMEIGGYYAIEAKDLDQALAIAARVPSAKVGAIEVRPVMVYN
jgi:hypothetical protein